MGLLDRILGRKKVKVNTEKTSSVPSIERKRNENCVKIMQFYARVDKMLAEKRYVAKSEYVSLVKQYDETINFFDVLTQSGMLYNFCSENGVDSDDISKAIHFYNNIDDIFDKHNEELFHGLCWKKRIIWIIFLNLLILKWFLMKIRER